MAEVTAAGVRATIDIVQDTWAKLLAVSGFGPDDDFFECGGHSLMAVSAVATLNERLGIELPPYALFAAPTPAEMAELIAEFDRQPDPRLAAGVTPFYPAWVVPLQREGAGRPVFVFPAGHNEMVALSIEARVAVHTGKSHPFWGFRREDPELDQARADGVTAVAAAYVAQMRAMQPQGPYLLYANCAGAPYAWDAASQLLAAGEEIAGLLFFEAPLRREAVAPRTVVTAQTTSPAQASERYRPPPLPVDLTLLMTRFWWERQWSARWEVVALGTVETVVIPGETEKAFVRREERIARHVREWIEQAEARVRGG